MKESVYSGNCFAEKVVVINRRSECTRYVEVAAPTANPFQFRLSK